VRCSLVAFGMGLLGKLPIIAGLESSLARKLPIIAGLESSLGRKLPITAGLEVKGIIECFTI
jgi:hypothetical protein